ncbi:GNAT family N-acetyltransferase [Paenibacillus solisilvae]|uniref:GNAT family N-acetyltransferase n=1 Tax=Paenibacillus solisilvae TaxID=2486751 RepID=A0ABW0W6Z0_9BACL
MKNPIGGMKKELEEMKASMDAMKSDVQHTVDEVKGTVAKMKETGALLKDFGKPDKTDGDIVREKNAFYFCMEEAGQIGEISYMPSDRHIWVINHTFVSPPYRNQGIAHRLLARLVETARAEGKQIIPICTFAAAEFKRDPAYADVWKQKQER